MLQQAFAVSGIVCVAIGGLCASNVMYDRGVPNSMSRYVAPLLGGLAFLAAVLWLDVWTATALSGDVSSSAVARDAALKKRT